MRWAPARGTEFYRRFELEADCLAGVWIQASEAWAKSDRFRSEMRAVLSSIGDYSLSGQRPGSPSVLAGVHGTSDQRTRWFERGAQSGDLKSCNTFAVADF